MERIINYIKNRLKEPSTIRGLILLVVGISGADLSPEEAQTLVTHALSIVGLFGLLPDNIQNNNKE